VLVRGDLLPGAAHPDQVIAAGRLLLAPAGIAVPLAVATAGTAPLTASVVGGGGVEVAGTVEAPTVHVTAAGPAGAAARVVLARGDARDTVRIVAVGGTAGLLLPDTLVVPDTPMRLVGPGASGAGVTVGGIAATVSADAAGRVAVAGAAVFAPCLPTGTRATVALDGAGADLPLEGVPLRLALAVGAHALPDTAVERGCDVEVQEAGAYAAVPYTAEQPRPQWIAYANRPLFPATLTVAPAPAAPSAARLAGVLPMAGATARARGARATLALLETARREAARRARVPAPADEWRPAVGRVRIGGRPAGRPVPGRAAADPFAPTPGAPLAGEAGIARAVRVSQAARGPRVRPAPWRPARLPVPGRTAAPGDLRVALAAARAAARVVHGAGAFGAAPAAGACATPTAQGATVQIGTVRYAGGPLAGQARYTSAYDPSAQDEPWTLAASTAHYAFFVDTTWLRASAGDSALQQRLDALAAAADSTILPVFARFGMAWRDDDGNGRVVVLVPYHAIAGASASAFYSPAFQGWGRTDCDNQAGEMVWFPSAWFTPYATGPGTTVDPTLGVGVKTLAHESGHLWEGPVQDASAGGASRQWYVGEAIARLVEVLWTLRGRADVFTGNVGADWPSATVAGSGRSASNDCHDGVETFGTQTTYYGGGGAYNPTCNFFFQVAGHLAAAGVPEGEVMTRLATAPGRGSLTDVANTLLRPGQPAWTADRVIGEWFLSWVADDMAAGVAPALVHRGMQQAPAYGFAQAGVPNAPSFHATFDGRTRSTVSFTGADQFEPLGRIEDFGAKFTLVIAHGPTRLRLARPDGTPVGVSRLRLGVVRLR
jgi:hypothetical protein